jgi:hypothetical protein
MAISDNLSADDYETEALERLDRALPEYAQVYATLAVSRRLADLRRDRTGADLLLESVETRADRERPAPNLGGYFMGQADQ